MQHGFKQTVISIEPKNLNFGNVVHEKIEKLTKNDQKNQTFDFSEGLKLVTEIFGRGRISKSAPKNPFCELNPTSQIWQGNFREYSTSLKNTRKIKKFFFSRAIIFLKHREWPLKQGISSNPLSPLNPELQFSEISF